MQMAGTSFSLANNYMGTERASQHGLKLNGWKEKDELIVVVCSKVREQYLTCISRFLAMPSGSVGFVHVLSCTFPLGKQILLIHQVLLIHSVAELLS
ncbi:hypothetical protein V6N13_149154 [Hibiscus sabdariffa]